MLAGMNSGTSDDLMSWIGQFGPFILGLALIGVAVLAWSGRWRGWARRGGNEQTDPWPSAKARSKGHR
jgi:hypothetical protein